MRFSIKCRSCPSCLSSRIALAQSRADGFLSPRLRLSLFLATHSPSLVPDSPCGGVQVPFLVFVLSLVFPYLVVGLVSWLLTELRCHLVCISSTIHSNGWHLLHILLRLVPKIYHCFQYPILLYTLTRYLNEY